MSKEVPCQRDANRPQAPTNDVIDEESAVMHITDASNNRGKGAHDRHKPRQNNGFSAVLLVKFLRLDQILLVEERRVFTLEEATTHAATKGVTCTVAKDGSEEAAYQ